MKNKNNVFSRKITQITVDPSLNDAPGLVFALCDDGTLWKRPVFFKNENEPDAWTQVNTNTLNYAEDQYSKNEYNQTEGEPGLTTDQQKAG